MKPKKILIGGKWIAGAENFSVKNPFTDKKIADVSAASPSQLSEAIDMADRCRDDLKKLPRYEIARNLRLIASLIEKKKEKFAKTITLESAKPIAASRGEVERAIATFNWAAGEAERFSGTIIPVDTIALGKGKSAITKWIPRGIVYGITPFNFPINLVAHKVAPALASKNPIIIKPSDKTPLTSLLLGEVFCKTDLPESALQIVPMNVSHIENVYADERIKTISFTGSAAVGWNLKTKASKKHVILELGGNAPVIIDETADLETSAQKCVSGAFAYSGQVCISVQRIYVKNKIFDEWTENFISKTNKLKYGNPLEEKTEISVMISAEAANKTENLLNLAVKNGAKILLGGNRKKSYLEPTVLTDINFEMPIVSEEIFAPIAVIEKYSEFEEAIDYANLTKYGLQAGVFTNSLQNMQFASDHLQFGGIIFNDVPTFRVDNMPYGGLKDSGFGREGIRYAMEEMCDLQLIVNNSQ